MSFTINYVDFYNGKSYDEIEHSRALYNGLPNFVQEGFDYNDVNNTINNGRAINNGLPIELGNNGETIAVPNNFSGFAILKTTLQGNTSFSEIVFLTSEQVSTNTVKYFSLYKFLNGSIDPTSGGADFRHVEYIKSVEILDFGNDQFALVINGTLSNLFDTGTIQNAYSKTEASQLFTSSISGYNTLPGNLTDNDFSGKEFAEILQLILNERANDYSGATGNFLYTQGFSVALPNAHQALENMMNTVYGVTFPSNSIFNIKISSPNRDLKLNYQMIVSTNQTRKQYYISCDNFGQDYLTKDADAFRPEITVTGEVQAKEIKNSIDDRSFMIYDAANGNKINDGDPDITFNLQGYAFSQMEKVVFVFKRNGVSTAYHNYILDNTEGIDVLALTQTVTMATSAGQTDPSNLAIKCFDLGSSILVGKTGPSTLNDSMVLHKVSCTVKEKVYNDEVNFLNAPINLFVGEPYNTINVDDVTNINGRGIFMKNATTSYEIDNLSEEEFEQFKIWYNKNITKQ